MREFDLEVWDSLPSQLLFEWIVVEERVCDFVTMENSLLEGVDDFGSGRWGPSWCLIFMRVAHWAI